MSCNWAWGSCGTPLWGPLPQKASWGCGSPQSLSGLQEAGTASMAQGETGPPKACSRKGPVPEAMLSLAPNSLLQKPICFLESARNLHTFPVKGQRGRILGATWSLPQRLNSALMHKSWCRHSTRMDGIAVSQ